MDDLIEQLFFVSYVDEQPDFEEWSASLALSFVERAEIDAGWMVMAIQAHPEQVIRLTPWMREIGGMFPPSRMDWFEWLDAVTRF